MISAIAQTAGRGYSAFYFHPEANVGEGATLTEDSIQEPEVLRVSLPDTTSAQTTQPDTSATLDDKAH